MFTKPFKNFLQKVKLYGYKAARKFFWPSYSIEELFPDAEKLSPIRPETVATSEVKKMNLAKRSKYLQTDNYSLPAIYTAHISQVIYYPRYDLILSNSGKVLKETNYINLHTLTPKQMLNLIKNVNPKVSKLLNYVNKPENILGFCSVIRRSDDSKNNHYQYFGRRSSETLFA